MEHLLDAGPTSAALVSAAADLAPPSLPCFAEAQEESAGGGGARVRRFESRDVAQVTDLFIETFRRGAAANRLAAMRCISEIYLAAPDGAHSLVHAEEDGAVTGFVGMLHADMQMNGRPLKVGILGAAMAARRERNPAVAVRLGRAVRAAPLDLLLSDTTNARSLVFGRALRFEVLPTHSLEWVKALRPAETLAGLLARRVAGLAPIAVGLARLVEPAARRLYDPSLKEQAPSANRTNLIDMDGFVERAETLTRQRPLKPEWRSDSMRWLIGRAALKVRNGPLRLYEVVEPDGRLAGVYILYAARGKVAHALQILARPNREREIIASLLRVADDEGAPAVRGVVDPTIMIGLAGVPRVFYHHGAATIAFSRDAEVRAALKQGEALIGGLIGERWSRLLADPFD